MGNTNRRRFLAGGAGVAALGVAALTTDRLATAATGEPDHELSVGRALSDDLLVVEVSQRQGRVHINNGERELQLTDHDLVRRIALLARTGA